MRKQFNLQDWLKDKSQKIETRNGRPVHYIGLDRAGWQVFEVFRTNGTSEYRTYHDSYLYSGPGESTFDLFIVTPEEEMSEFEKELESFYNHHLQVCTYDNQGTVEDSLHDGASKLLAIARDQFIKDGYILEKKAFHDAVEKVSPEVMKEVSDKVDTEEALRLGYEKGRAEALKDLPRWREWGNGCAGNSDGHPIALVSGAGGIRFVSVLGVTGEKYIMLSDLKKLPGFKED